MDAPVKKQKTAQGQGLIKYNAEVIAELDACAAKAAEVARIGDGQAFSKAFAIAEVMVEIRAALCKPGVMDIIDQLKGSAIGFQTDRDNGKNGPPYRPEELVEPVLEAIMYGVPLVGNNMNVISRRMYVTKNGFGFKLKNLTGLSMLRIVHGIPHMVPGGATVTTVLSWEYNGVKGQQDLQLAIRVNAGMGADAVLGKAHRKAEAWLYNYLTGSEMPDGEVEDMRAGSVDVKSSPLEQPIATAPAPETPAPDPTPLGNTTTAPSESAEDKAKSREILESSSEDLLNRVYDFATKEKLSQQAIDNWVQARHGSKSLEDISSSKRRELMYAILTRPDAWVRQVVAYAKSANIDPYFDTEPGSDEVGGDKTEPQEV